MKYLDLRKPPEKSSASADDDRPIWRARFGVTPRPGGAVVGGSYQF